MLSSNTHICASCGYAVPAAAFSERGYVNISRKQVGKVKTLLFVCLGLGVLGVAALSYNGSEPQLAGPGVQAHAALRR